MREFHSVLITANFPPSYHERLKALFAPAKVTFCRADDTEGIAAALVDADAAVLGSDVNDTILTGKKLTWIHCDHSGLTLSARPEVFERGIAVTGAAGRSAPTLAEHAIFFMLSLTYDVYGLHDLQKKHQWGGLPGYSDRRGLFGKTVGIVGLGHAGAELARRCKAFGMRVLAYKRSEKEDENVDVLYCAERGDTIDPILRESDFVVLMIGLNDETYHMIGAQQLRQMKSSAYLINMCRGSVVDENALIDALKQGVISGAGLDTLEKEPPTPDLPIWDAPNVMITPHNTPTVPDRWERSFQIVEENARRYREEKSLLNQITIRDLYTKRK